MPSHNMALVAMETANLHGPIICLTTVIIDAYTGVLVKGGKFSTFLRLPEWCKKIDKSAQAVHGITMETIDKKGLPRGRMFRAFAKHLEKHKARTVFTCDPYTYFEILEEADTAPTTILTPHTLAMVYNSASGGGVITHAVEGFDTVNLNDHAYTMGYRKPDRDLDHDQETILKLLKIWRETVKDLEELAE